MTRRSASILIAILVVAVALRLALRCISATASIATLTDQRSITLRTTDRRLRLQLIGLASLHPGEHADSTLVVQYSLFVAEFTPSAGIRWPRLVQATRHILLPLMVYAFSRRLPSIATAG
jgi:hypothetical protein